MRSRAERRRAGAISRSGSPSTPARRSSRSTRAPARARAWSPATSINTAARLQAAAPVERDPRRRARRTARPSATIDYRELEPGRGEGQGRAGARSGRPSRHDRGSASTSAELRARRSSAASASSTCSSDALATRARRALAAARDARRRARDREERLVYELCRVVDADDELITWRQGRSLPYGEGVTFWALGEIVKAQAGILETDRRRRRPRRSSRTPSQVVSDEGERTLDRAAPAAARRTRKRGSDAPAIAAARRSRPGAASSRRSREQRPARARLRGPPLGRRRPARLRRPPRRLGRRRPAPRRVHGRPELLERRRAGAEGSANATTVSLAPLDDDETARLVVALLERPVLDGRRPSASCSSAPAATRSTRRSSCACSRPGGEHRADGCPRPCRGSSRRASTSFPRARRSCSRTRPCSGRSSGRMHWRRLPGSSRGSCRRRSARLERKEFVRREHRSSIAGASQHAFEHALVRDAAYGQIPRVVRAARHVTAAEWIESLPTIAPRIGRRRVAHHYVTAIELFRAAGEDDSSVRARACAGVAGRRRALAVASRVSGRCRRSSRKRWSSFPRARSRPQRCCSPQVSRSGTTDESATSSRARSRRSSARETPNALRRPRSWRAVTHGMRSGATWTCGSTVRGCSSRGARRHERRLSSSPNARGGTRSRPGLRQVASSLSPRSSWRGMWVTWRSKLTRS